MIQRIDHIELIVADREATVRFLEKIGFQEVRRTSHHKIAVELALPGDNQPIWEIHQVAIDEVPGINHIGFHCSDVEAEYKELTGKGIAFQQGPHYIKETGRTLADFRDPDGWRYHLVATK